MNSPARTLSNQANAQLSTGPRTEHGKAASSQNARRHGLTSNRVVLPGEDPAEYDALRANLLREYQPLGETELTLVDELAACSWRLVRARSVETAAYKKMVEGSEDPAAVIAGQLVAQPAAIDRMQRYVTAFERAYYRALNKLTAIHKERRQQTESRDPRPAASSPAQPDFLDEDDLPPRPVPLASFRKTSRYLQRRARAAAEQALRDMGPSVKVHGVAESDAPPDLGSELLNEGKVIPIQPVA